MSDMLQSFLDFWIDVVLFVPRIIFWAALQVLEQALLILPEFDVDPSVFTTGFTADLVYFLTMFEFNTGLGFIASALVARFLLRRIPLIG